MLTTCLLLTETAAEANRSLKKTAMITIYQLKKDKRQISSIQKITLKDSDFALQQIHGLFGSEEWWRQIADGRLPLYTHGGTITRIDKLCMGNGAEFEMASSDGTKESFFCECNTPAQCDEYQVGRFVEIDYVWQKYKVRYISGSGLLDRKIVIEIRIDNSEPSSTGD